MMRSVPIHVAAMAVACLLLLCVPSAQAGRPFSTEDAGVLERGSCELESFAERTRADDSPRTTGVQLTGNCGVGLSTQLGVSAARTRADGESETRALVGGKTALNAPDDRGSAWTIAYGFDAPRQNGTTRIDTMTALLVVTHPLDGNWVLHANAGGERSRLDARNRALWALALERTALGPLDAGVEVYGDDRGERFFGVGLRLALVASRLWADASCARAWSDARAQRCTVGLKAAF